MAFYGCDFTFDDKRASTFFQPATPGTAYKKLMVYNIGSYGQDDVDFSVGEAIEDRINRRYSSLLYGTVQNEPLQFTLVFGIDPDDLEGEEHLTREQISQVTKWLTGHQEYKILTIDQEDMQDYRYHAMVTGLRLISEGGLPVAFSAEITCDGPFAYRNPVIFYSSTEMDGGIYIVDNPAMTNDVFYPILDIDISGATYIQFVNLDDANRTMRFDGIPTESGLRIHADCYNQILTTSTGYNLYPGFNMKFMRFVPGENNIQITTDGSAEVITTCEYPVNIGA